MLSNAIEWKIYRIKFGQPIDYEEVYSFDVCKLSSRSAEDLTKLFMLCRESISSDSLAEYHRHAQIVNRYVISEILQSDAMIATLRRELRKLFEGVRATDEDLRVILTTDVLKRDTIDGDPPKSAKAVVKKAVALLAKKAAKAAS